MKYKVLRTDTADALIRNIVLYIAENFGDEIALNKLDGSKRIHISGQSQGIPC